MLHVTSYRHTANNKTNRIKTQIESEIKYGHADFSIKSTKKLCFKCIELSEGQLFVFFSSIEI